ncbi:MAG: Bug family tripartite tricarboxylate transporter substrate binding protein [Gemmatimonas sp.]
MVGRWSRAAALVGVACVALGVELGGARSAPAQSVKADAAVEQFYRGQSLRILVGYGPGTGYDVYARVLGRHIARYVPGQPTVVIQNMPGAASLAMTNHLYNVAPRDGSTIGAPARGLLIEPLFGNANARYDGRRFTWIGSISREVATCLSWQGTGFARIDDVKAREMLVGATGTVSPSYLFPQIMNAMIGTRFKVVPGYPDSGAVGIAMERGELHGYCSFSWGSLKSARKDWLDNRRVTVMVQLSLTGTPELADVPSVMSYAKDDATRQAFELVFADQEMARPVGGPPELPADRLKALRAAFDATMKDKEFLADAERTGVEVDPIDGPAVQAILDRLYRSSPDVIATVKRVRGTEGRRGRARARAPERQGNREGAAMAVNYAVDNEHKLFVTCYFRDVTESEIHAAVAALADAVTGEGEYRELVIFRRGVDLSVLDTTALNNIRRGIKDAYRRLGLTRGRSAAVVDTALEARFIMPLWNALCEADPEPRLDFEIFADLEPALAFLGLPVDFTARVAALVPPAAARA